MTEKLLWGFENRSNFATAFRCRLCLTSASSHHNFSLITAIFSQAGGDLMLNPFQLTPIEWTAR